MDSIHDIDDGINQIMTRYCSPWKRIADSLLLEEEEEEEEEEENDDKENEVKSCGFECSSLGRAIWRWSRWEFGNGLGSLSVSRIRRRLRMVRRTRSTGRMNQEKRICSTWNLQGVFCISVNKNELHKMEDLWKELEVLLQNVKEKVQRKDSSREPSELTECVASFFTDIKEVLSCGNMQSNQSSGCESKQEPVEGIEEVAPKESASASGCSTSFGKLMNPRDEVTEVQSGAEFPLISYLRKREISWWKDTALLRSQHVSEPSHGGLADNGTSKC
ncbi:hypothetical protein ACJRO7_015351 [Eucalyptus globulus]|uniref:Uncharacterized protein n=1 Tax=Eucalyptus globulus TaxID=34317 RepID=A0ABD3L747_EUCGL